MSSSRRCRLGSRAVGTSPSAWSAIASTCPAILSATGTTPSREPFTIGSALRPRRRGRRRRSSPSATIGSSLRSRAGAVGTWEFVVEGWVDAFTSWRHGTRKKLEAGHDVGSDLVTGALLLRACSALAQDHHPGDALALRAAAHGLEDASLPLAQRFSATAEAEVVAAAGRHADRSDATRTDPYGVVVDPPRARFSAWYEMFPRSAGAPGKHGTLRDCARRARLTWPRWASTSCTCRQFTRSGARSARDPTTRWTPGPPTSGVRGPSGRPKGGTRPSHPELGTLDDLRALVRDGAGGGHRGRDRHRAPGLARPSVRARAPRVVSSPPRRVDSSTQRTRRRSTRTSTPSTSSATPGRACGKSSRASSSSGASRGSAIFRVDNPHTKPLRFWEWCIGRGQGARTPKASFSPRRSRGPR